MSIRNKEHKKEFYNFFNKYKKEMISNIRQIMHRNNEFLYYVIENNN